jgi:hypothetical protein
MDAIKKANQYLYERCAIFPPYELLCPNDYSSLWQFHQVIAVYESVLKITLDVATDEGHESEALLWCRKTHFDCLSLVKQHRHITVTNSAAQPIWTWITNTSEFLRRYIETALLERQKIRYLTKGYILSKNQTIKIYKIISLPSVP